ncbi:MAG: phage holin family protein, partial [Gemmatimonadales bacterium]
MTARPIVTDPDTGIPDLIRRLTDDSKRLMTDEVQLAKLETKESLHRATRGMLWMALAFGAGVVMLA